MKRCSAAAARTAEAGTLTALLREDLAALESAGLLRVPSLPNGLLSFCSNDYLGLAQDAAPVAPCGAGASRLVSGNCAEHEALERAVCDWLGLPSALVFSSGYAANVGLLSALGRDGDLIVSDALNHASIIDGARLSRARVEVVPHLDVDAVVRVLRRRTESRAFVVTESYFSMDADTPDLRGLRGVCDELGAVLVVDEAHALGVLGAHGRGLCAEAGIVPDALVGTFGKALGAGGAFVGGSPELRLWLWNRARPFVFSTGLSPIVAAAAEAAIARVRTEPDLRRIVAARAQELREGLRGRDVLGYGHIVPWTIGDPRQAVAATRALMARGMFAQAIRPPSVPWGTARIRFTVTAKHTAADVARLVAEVACL